MVLEHCRSLIGPLKKLIHHGTATLIFITSGAIILGLFSCATQETEQVETVHPPPPVHAPNEKIESEEILPTPYTTDWAGTSWIIRDPEIKKSFPGYRGFHLGRDGRLLLINMDMATGNRWFTEENLLHLSISSGVSDIPIDGSFFTVTPDENNQLPVRVRFVPKDNPESDGLIFEKAVVKIDIVENHWKLQRINGDYQAVWPMNREIHFMLLPDENGDFGILGFGGENRFSGKILFQEEKFILGPLAKTLKSGPADEFEALYLQRLSEATRYVQVEQDMFLYNGIQPVASFRAQLFD